MAGQKTIIDVLIIGAGPAGISAAAEAFRVGIRPNAVVVIEKEEQHNSTIRKFYPNNKIVAANYKGQVVESFGELKFADMSKAETLSYFDQVIDKYAIPIVYRTQVKEITKFRDYFLVVTTGESYVARTVFVAIGMMGQPNRPSYPIDAAVESRIKFDLKDHLTGKVLVVGGGDSASEYAQFLAVQNGMSEITYRQESFHRMNEENLMNLKEMRDTGAIRFRLGQDVARIEVQDEKPLAVFTTGEKVLYDFILFAIGGTRPRDFLEAIGIDFVDNRPNVSESYETRIDGLFILGDLSADKSGGSIISAFNSSVKALSEACYYYLDCQ